MNTYAELYGNIKKRLLKSSLGNKLILGNISSITPLEELESLTNKAGDTMASIYDTVSPLNLQIQNDNLLASQLNDRSFGIKICPLYE